MSLKDYFVKVRVNYNWRLSLHLVGKMITKEMLINLFRRGKNYKQAALSTMPFASLKKGPGRLSAGRRQLGNHATFPWVFGNIQRRRAGHE